MPHLIVGIILSTPLVLSKWVSYAIMRWLDPDADKRMQVRIWVALVEWGYLILIASGLSYALDALTHFAAGWSLVLAVFLVALIPTFDFIIKPYLLLLRGDINPVNVKMESWVPSALVGLVKLRVYEGNLVNAYATGIVPFSRVVILGKPLVENLSESSLRGIVAHEIGHLRDNHLPLLYASSLLGTSIMVVCLSWVIQMNLSDSLEGLLVVATVTIVYGCYFILFHQRVVMRRLEYAADQFAADAVGTEAYTQALKELDTTMEGGLSRGNVSHPSLEKRLQHVKAHDRDKEEPVAAGPGH